MQGWLLTRLAGNERQGSEPEGRHCTLLNPYEPTLVKKRHDFVLKVFCLLHTARRFCPQNADWSLQKAASYSFRCQNRMTQVLSASPVLSLLFSVDFVCVIQLLSLLHKSYVNLIFIVLPI